MKWRGRLAGLQVVVFVSGGLLAPALHIAWHRPDHSHGWTAAVDLHSSEGSTAPRPARAQGNHGPAPAEIARHAHPHAHPHPHPHPGHGATPATEKQSAGPQTQPIERTHGHGSLAHLGLALLSGPPPMALPTPRPLGLVPRRAHPRVVSLYRPGFPPPRPPPTAVCS